MSNSRRPYGQQPSRLRCPQDSLGKNTGVGCHFLLQRDDTFSLKILQKNFRRRNNPKLLFYKATITLILKADKDITKAENYILVSLMTMDTKILNKILSYILKAHDCIFVFLFSAGSGMNSIYLWRRKWQPTPVFLPRESCGQSSMVGCHLWVRIELDMTEAT